jgi:hypothetical protein
VVKLLYLRNLSPAANKTRHSRVELMAFHFRAVQREMLAESIFETLARATAIVSIPEPVIGLKNYLRSEFWL